MEGMSSPAGAGWRESADHLSPAVGFKRSQIPYGSPAAVILQHQRKAARIEASSDDEHRHQQPV